MKCQVVSKRTGGVKVPDMGVTKLSWSGSSSPIFPASDHRSETDCSDVSWHRKQNQMVVSTDQVLG